MNRCVFLEVFLYCNIIVTPSPRLSLYARTAFAFGSVLKTSTRNIPLRGSVYVHAHGRRTTGARVRRKYDKCILLLLLLYDDGDTGAFGFITREKKPRASSPCTRAIIFGNTTRFISYITYLIVCLRLVFSYCKTFGSAAAAATAVASCSE